MRVEELRGGKTDDLTLVIDPAATRPDDHAEIDIRRIGDDVCLIAGGVLVPVSGFAPGTQQRLEEVVDSGLPAVAWVVKATAAQILVRVHRFQRQIPLSAPLSIGVDEQVRDDVRRRFSRGGSVAETARWLDDMLVLGPAPLGEASERRAVLSAGPRGGAELDASGFRLYASRFAVDVKREDDQYRVVRIVTGARVDEAAMQLVVGAIEFQDASAAGKVAGGVGHLLEAAVRASGSYLAIWQTYSRMETEAILRRARAFGSLAYDQREQRADGGWRFHLADPPADLQARLPLLGEDGRIEVEASREPPMWDTLDGPAPKEERLAASLRRVQDGWAELRAPEDDEDDEPRPPNEGFLSISLRGDRTRISRRAKAESRIRQGNCPMPWLGLLLEGQPAPKPAYRKRDAMGRGVRRSFGGQPTPKQEEALRIALNTPDVAMIQGPPGTGKTRVILALQCRLADIAEKGREVRHRVLVTSAQHDAVEEVARKTEVFELPAVKIGARKGQPHGDAVPEWRNKRIKALQDGPLRDPPVAERLQVLRRLAAACLYAPTPPRDLSARLRELRLEAGDLVTPALSDRLLDRARVLAGHEPLADASAGNAALLTVTRGLRVEPGPFADDGPDRAERAAVALRKLLTDDERHLLRECADWMSPDPMPSLEDVRALQDRLVDLLRPPPPASAGTLDDETQRLLLDFIDEADRHWRTSRHADSAVLASYLEDLEGDEDGLRDAITRYTVVLAATLQQAGGRLMLDARGIETGSADFDTVIVDEAARAHPLDLLIPMSLAERRLVFVGDQRQLPHMLEPEVERDLTEALARGDISAEAREALKDSLFARLWAMLRKLEALDGHRRTVTLDTQFRMHPLLGAFVSRNFYERRGDPEIRSAGKAIDYAHSLKDWQRDGRDVVAGWLDVPGGPGRWEVRGRSKSRIPEARAVARATSDLVAADPSATVGIITFYADQVIEIWRALEGLGLATRAGERGWRIRKDLADRVLVGTVDAFQGKEFDVVLLSIVRSNDFPGETDEHLRRKYGHLLLENRLCVGMSRQKRLLVGVGDRAFVAGSTTEWLEPLRDFLTLCGGPDGLHR